ncbi:hypothetical protein BWGOE3_09750 [Bacillus mycoides]|uniref:hypothetical protein n=1 Tax=Bacillus cereus group TaxID=86661 RepID=UPI0008732C45|nr:hypothetical protein [Bacillus mycoides]OFD46324.1 hypothetical protein BWGOE2_09660 [Bacillus mycoides]OFD49234.1 hypothetical protein BWGOE1_10150 [Bacillus mycoides]OFD51559.1 hypothetical protein BWGOE3_09750 [Bacillus mycoides]OFD63991.1 hypothetical protein BWGOE6_09720 [Bacillus mycoides]
MSKKRKRYNHYAKNIKKKRKRADSKLTLIQRMLRLTAKILYAIIVLFIISIVKYVILPDYWSELPVEVAVIPFFILYFHLFDDIWPEKNSRRIMKGIESKPTFIQRMLRLIATISYVIIAICIYCIISIFVVSWGFLGDLLLGMLMIVFIVLYYQLVVWQNKNVNRNTSERKKSGDSDSDLSSGY